MGASLTRAAQWTTASWEGGELEAPPPMNDFLLGEILRFAETFDSRHPREAEHVFKEPLQWRTALAASDFKTGYDIRNSDVQSREKDGDGRPLLQLCPPAVSVRSFGQLSKLLQLAGDKKLGEVRACLQENRGLVAKILGRRFADVLEDAGGRSGAQSLAGAEAEVELFLLLQSVDERLLEQSLRGTPELDPAAVRAEVELLQRLCDEGERRALKSVRHTSDYEFSNGHSAPPGGQQHMDICNLIIEPCDTETLHVTCSTAGVFLTKQGQEGGSERTSDVFRDLVALLKSRSPHFAASIKQDFAVRELPSARGTRHVESVEAEERGQRHGPREPQEKNAPEKARVQRGPHRAGGKKKYEPCPRWTSLRRSSSNGEMKEPMSGDLHKRKAGLGAKGKMKGELSVSSVPAGLSSQKIKTPAGGDVFNESSSESEEEEEEPERCPESNVDLPSEYWQIQKLVKYLKGGDQTATVLTLCALMDFSLMQETCQLAIRDVGGLEVLINLLDTDEVKCKIGSLKILRKICHNVQIRQAIVDMGGLQSIVAILDSPVKELQALAAETVANVARFRRARRIVRQYGGIRKLVKLLDCVSGLAKLTAKNQERDVEVARCGALALWSCSKTSRNKEAIRQAGGIPLLGRLLKSPHKNMLIPVVGTLQECASVENYRIAIQTEGMIKDLVKNLSSDNDELQMHCASAIFKCAEDKQTRDLVRQYRGLQPLVALLSKADNKHLLAAATGAIWKCSISPENVTKFQEYKTLESLVGLLIDQPEEVLVNVVGALGEFAQIPANKVTICKSGGIKSLINLLTGTNQALLVNVTKAVGACATDTYNMAIIDQLDGVRLVWSLLKNPSADVQRSAAWALCPCVENAKDAGEMVRSLVGGLELIVTLLKSTNTEVLASICAAVAKIAKDKENLAVLTDHGVVPLLASLTNTTDNRLLCHLAEAIGRCCMWGSNRTSFGDAGAVPPLVHYLKSKDSAVHKSTVMALYQLSKEPNNCITMHRRGAVKPLIHFMGSDDAALQEYSAGCVRNIARLAQANRDTLLYV
ncbi:outer dynein arm-docking complex subunit 2 isoform X5 [Nelusetta ayraudi]|uniref:outer dynein arm-docking complex subunit 2 isoform X5 n=1 Tax=Nelusetta ayraudi TaxID=303726 RepID=UPI003F72A1F3